MSEVVTMEAKGEAVGIENIKIAFNKLKEVIDNAVVIMEDGKIGFGDLTMAPEMFMDIKDLVSASMMVGDEAKDLSGDEIKEILGMLIELGTHIAGKLSSK